MKVAAVGYLNALPLVHDLAGRVDLTFGSPSEVARRLAEDECDVALMPVAAAAALGDVTILPGMAIAADGPVRSVIVVAECPIDELEEVALDLSSKTSVVLAKILLGKKRWKGMPPEKAIAAVKGKTGALVIGDAALAIEGKFPHVLDLGAAWKEKTGLPFVFAAWCTRKELAPADIEILRNARDAGLAQRDRLPDGDLKKYLTESIRYELEPRALDRFFDEAAKLKLLPARREGARPAGAPSEASLDSILSRAADGERLSAHEGLRLLSEGSLFDLGLAADAVRRSKHPHGVVTYIIDRNISYTNVCTTSCRFCAFYRPVGHAEGYVLSRDTLAKKLQEVVDAGGVQILLQGGLNPDLRIEWYEDLFRWIKREYKLGLHALSPEEIIHIGRLENLTIERVLERLHAAGLDSVPGGGAEILVDRVRRKIAKAKCTSSQWLDVMRAAHHMGLRSSSTMMYGTVDTARDRILHLLKLRDLQDETGGFTAFFCWDFQHEKGTRVAAGDTGTHLYLRTQAVARLMLDNIHHVGASWVTQGPDVGQVALRFGADDFGSVMFEENVVSSAGTVFCIDAPEIERRIRDAGFRAVRRNVRYEWLNTPS